MSYTIRGLGKLMAKLDAIGGNSSEVIEKSIENVTVFVRDDARLRCPVDSGDLRQSIDYEVTKEEGKVKGTVFTNTDYAPYVEFGTGPVGEASNEQAGITYRQEKWLVNIPEVGLRYTEGQPAQPFMYPAIKDNVNQIEKKFKNDLNKAIKEVASR